MTEEVRILKSLNKIKCDNTKKFLHINNLARVKLFKNNYMLKYQQHEL